MAEVKLFTARCSPYGQRVVLGLTEKNIPFDITYVDLSNKPQEFLDANPIHQRVPTIIHNGKAVAESLVILEYLEDVWPEQVPLLPKDPYERSKVRFWVDYINKNLFAAGLSATMKTQPGSPERAAAIEASIKGLRNLEVGMCSFSGDGPFFAGDTFGMADVVLSPLVSSAPVAGKYLGIEIPGPEELPRLHKWMEAARVHPSLKALPDTEEVKTAFLWVMKKFGVPLPDVA